MPKHSVIAMHFVKLVYFEPHPYFACRMPEIPSFQLLSSCISSRFPRPGTNECHCWEAQR